MGRESAPGRNPLGRALQALTLVLFLTLLFAAAFSAVRLAPYAETRDVRWAFLVAALPRGLLFGVLGLGGWLVLAGPLQRRLGKRGGLLATAGFLPGLGVLAFRLNHDLLPGAFEPASLIANAALFPALALSLVLLAALLGRWQRGAAWRDGRLPLPGLAAGGALLAVCLALGARVPAGPNVVILLIDVLRADHLGCYGYERPTSPNIDAFAADAVLFENTSSASTFTKTSVASLFSGLHPHHHGVYRGDLEDSRDRITSDVLAGRFDTLAERARDLGLHTEAWVQNGQLRDYMGFAQGFSRYHDQPGLAPTITALHREWLRRVAPHVRSLTYLHLIDLHAPYIPTEPFLGRFGPPEEGLDGIGYAEWHDFKLEVANGERVLDQEDIDFLRDRYDECLLNVDRWVGRILDDLRAAGRYDDSLIMITADHGEAFREHGFISHSNLPYEELVHVPLIVKLPGSRNAGERVDELVGLVDVLPTVLDFLGAPVPEDLDGASLLPLLEDPSLALPPRTQVIEYRKAIGLRDERWKYVFAPLFSPRLFDLTKDPDEQVNLIELEPEVAAEFARRVDQVVRLRDATGEAEQVVIDEKTIEELKALGYL